MSSLWWGRLSAEERLLAEQAVLQYRALRTACAEAPHGKVLGVAERLAVNQGREMTRRTLETALQQEAAEAEKKGAPAESALTAKRRGPTADAKSGTS
jgi:hypothetical protein